MFGVVYMLFTEKRDRLSNEMCVPKFKMFQNIGTIYMFAPKTIQRSKWWLFSVLVPLAIMTAAIWGGIESKHWQSSDRLPASENCLLQLNQNGRLVVPQADAWQCATKPPLHSGRKNLLTSQAPEFFFAWHQMAMDCATWAGAKSLNCSSTGRKKAENWREHLDMQWHLYFNQKGEGFDAPDTRASPVPFVAEEIWRCAWCGLGHVAVGVFSILWVPDFQKDKTWTHLKR